MADSRTYIKLDDHLPENPKLLRAGDAAAWLYVCGLCYCSRQLTDGVIPREALPRLIHKNAEKLAKVLVELGLWEEHPAHFAVHDYLLHQRSREHIENERRKSRARAAKSRRNAPEVREPDTDTEAEEPPLAPPQGGTDASQNPRANGTAPRQLARKQEAATLQERIASCEECSDKAWTCARCERMYREIEGLVAS